MDKFCIITNLNKDYNLYTTKLIKSWLEKNGKTVYLPLETQEMFNKSPIEDKNIYKMIDCAIILGGDGTIIHSARQLALHNVPIIGVNLGTLGFLAEVEKKEVIDVLDKIIFNDYIIESRMMLKTDIHRSNGEKISGGIGLNDAVITRGGFSRIIELAVYVNDQLIDIYLADGIIVSTPTGSTAYSLSAGGPILNPTTVMMAITPICPHSLTARSIVVSGEDRVLAKVLNIRNKDEGDVLLTIDGQLGYKLYKDDCVTIQRSKYKTDLIKLKDNNFYTLLRRKIGMQGK